MKRYVKEFAVDILRTVANRTNENYRKDVESRVDRVITQYEGNYITAFEAVEQLVTVAKLTTVPDDRLIQSKGCNYDIAKIKEFVRNTKYRFDTQAYEKDGTVQVMRVHTIKSNPYVYEGLVIVLRPINATTITVEINYEKITETQRLTPDREERTLYACEIKSQDCNTVYDLLKYSVMQWDLAYIRQVLVEHGYKDMAVKMRWGKYDA